MNTKTEETGFTPPYIAFRTLTNLIARLDDEGAPPQLDRSFLSGSEGGKTQVLNALKTLGLIGDKGEIKPALSQLITADAEARRDQIRELMQKLYPEPVRLGTINATQQQLEDAFRAYGVSGDTLRKAVAFYLKGAEYAGIPVSQHFRTPKITRAGGSKPRVRHVDPGSGGNSGDTPPTPPGDSMNVSVKTALAGVLMQLPPNGPPWTEDRREQFKTTFSTVLDFSYPLTDSADAYEDDEGDYEE